MVAFVRNRWTNRPDGLARAGEEAKELLGRGLAVASHRRTIKLMFWLEPTGASRLARSLSVSLHTGSALLSRCAFFEARPSS